MSPNKTKVDHPIWVIDLHDQAVLITTDIEHYAASLQDAGVSVLGFDVCRCGPVGLIHLGIPVFQGFLSVNKPPIPFPELPQGALGNNPHATILLSSQFGNKSISWATAQHCL